MNPAILQTRRVAARHGVRVVQGRPGGPELDVLLVLVGDGDPPRNLHAPPRDGDADVVGVLVQMWATRPIPAPRLATDMAMGRAPGTSEKVKVWECWGPRGTHRIGLLVRTNRDDPAQALEDLLRQTGPRHVLAAAADTTGG